MSDHGFRARRDWAALKRRMRELRLLAWGALHKDHPIMAHLIPIRRCNLSCTYCNEFDDFSAPVPTEVLFDRIDRLGRLGTGIVTISGGEPLLHPDLDQVIARIRRNGVIAGLITNGYLLTADRIERLNRAGLDHMQISIDNVMPDEVSKKSLKVLDRKLQLLARHALFHVNINSVVGGGVKHPDDALTIAQRAVALGFSSTIGIIHDHTGQLKPLSDREREIYRAVKALEKRNYSQLSFFQEAIAKGEPLDWRCRAGARYLYICEDGLVHYCSQQRGYPAKPLADYALADIRREYVMQKACAPFCTVSCVHYVSYFDFWRGPQTIADTRPYEPPGSPLVQVQTAARP
jgi:MoaA/NifB/PqqE/SkfB family radical SAM enzyme